LLKIFQAFVNLSSDEPNKKKGGKEQPATLFIFLVGGDGTEIPTSGM
jgi:hypothetical protein